MENDSNKQVIETNNRFYTSCCGIRVEIVFYENVWMAECPICGKEYLLTSKDDEEKN